MVEPKKSFYESSVPKDWSTPEFGTVFSFLRTFPFSRDQLVAERSNGAVLSVHYGDIHAVYENEILDLSLENRVPFLRDGLIDPREFDDDKFPALKEGDLVIADASEDYVGVCEAVELRNVVGHNVTGGLHTFAARADQRNIAIGFRTYVLRHPQVVRQLRRLSTGISVFSVSKTNLSKVKIALPPLVEQKTIAHVLGLMDNAIELNNKIIAQKELRKKWLATNLLTGKKRLRGFGNEVWPTIVLKDILKPVRKALNPAPNELYQQIGIRSHAKGLFYKEPTSGMVLGDKRVFWIEPDCFILNIVFAWEHAVAKTTDAELGMIASHRFPMYRPKRAVLDLDYLLYYFSSARGKYLLSLASPGGAGRNKTLSQSDFMNLHIPLPSFAEQTAIADVLRKADMELSLLKAKNGMLRDQKKGLMQLLLTGKNRLNVADQEYD